MIPSMVVLTSIIKWNIYSNVEGRKEGAEFKVKKWLNTKFIHGNKCVQMDMVVRTSNKNEAVFNQHVKFNVLVCYWMYNGLARREKIFALRVRITSGNIN